MIKIQVDEIKIKEIEEKHWKWFKGNILKNWIAKIKRESDDEFLEIFFRDRNSFEQWFDNTPKTSIQEWIENQDDIKFSAFKELLLGNINSLKKIKNRLGIIRGTKDKIKKYFERQYNQFRNSQDQWGGAFLIDELNITVCPYCNRSFIDTYICDETGKIKSNAQLDHFYPQEQYPYFALSMYNLIPCCGVCNLGKLSDNKEIVYPYEEDFGNYAKFETSFLKGEENESYDIRYLLGVTDNFRIKIKINKEIIKDKLILESKEKKCKLDLEKEYDNINQKIENSIKIFHLEDLYNFHKENVRELIKKAIIYNKSRIDELCTQYPELFTNREEVLQMVVSNYICDEDLGKRPLAKLTKDICEELGLR